MAYIKGMADLAKLNLHDPPAVPDEEDEETLAAIDEGIREADAGLGVSSADVRKMMAEWIATKSSTSRDH